MPTTISMDINQYNRIVARMDSSIQFGEEETYEQHVQNWYNWQKEFDRQLELDYQSQVLQEDDSTPKTDDQLQICHEDDSTPKADDQPQICQEVDSTPIATNQTQLNQEIKSNQKFDEPMSKTTSSNLNCEESVQMDASKIDSRCQTSKPPLTATEDHQTPHGSSPTSSPSLPEGSLNQDFVKRKQLKQSLNLDYVMTIFEDIDEQNNNYNRYGPAYFYHELVNPRTLLNVDGKQYKVFKKGRKINLLLGIEDYGNKVELNDKLITDYGGMNTAQSVFDIMLDRGGKNARYAIMVVLAKALKLFNKMTMREFLESVKNNVLVLQTVWRINVSKNGRRAGSIGWATAIRRVTSAVEVQEFEGDIIEGDNKATEKQKTLYGALLELSTVFLKDSRLSHCTANNLNPIPLPEADSSLVSKEDWRTVQRLQNGVSGKGNGGNTSLFSDQLSFNEKNDDNVLILHCFRIPTAEGGWLIYTWIYYRNAQYYGEITVAVHSQNKEVLINFGKEPFVFVVKAFEAQEKRKKQAIVEDTILPPNVSYGIVRSYLSHYRYEDNSYTLSKRKVLRQLIRNGEIDATINKRHEGHPHIIQEASSVGCFLLYYQQFVELVRVGKMEEAVMEDVWSTAAALRDSDHQPAKENGNPIWSAKFTDKATRKEERYDYSTLDILWNDDSKDDERDREEEDDDMRDKPTEDEAMSYQRALLFEKGCKLAEATQPAEPKCTQKSIEKGTRYFMGLLNDGSIPSRHTRVLLVLKGASGLILEDSDARVFRRGLMIPAHTIWAVGLTLQTWALEKTNHSKEAIADLYRFIWNLSMQNTLYTLFRNTQLVEIIKVLNGFVAIVRHCRFLLFGIEEGHCSCPKTGQMLVHTRLVPNRTLRNLIMQWCTGHGFPFDPPESTDSAEAGIIGLAADYGTKDEEGFETLELLEKTLRNRANCSDITGVLSAHEYHLGNNDSKDVELPGSLDNASQSYVNNRMTQLLGDRHVDAGIHVHTTRGFIESAGNLSLTCGLLGKLMISKVNLFCDSAQFFDHSLRCSCASFYNFKLEDKLSFKGDGLSCQGKHFK